MTQLAAFCFAMAAVALLSSTGSRPERGVAIFCAALSVMACIGSGGVLEGLIVAFVLGMAVSSIGVLVLSPRPAWARPVAYVSALVGANAWLLVFALGISAAP
jgi:hypothetical protein